MKIVKERSDESITPLVVRLPEKLIKQLTELAKDNGLSRQKLIAAIIQKALADKSFKIRIKE